MLANLRGSLRALVRDMDAQSPRPYDIKVRTFRFACAVVSAFPRTHLNPPSQKVWTQLVAAATSTGAHLEEAAAGGSRAHFLSITRGGLREMREANYWLRIIAATQLMGHQSVPALLEESSELVAILTAIVRNTVANQGQQA